MPKQTSKTSSKQRSQSTASKQSTGSVTRSPAQNGANGQGARAQGKQSARRAAQQAAKQQKQQQLQRDRRSGRITLFSFIGAGIIILAAIAGFVIYNQQNQASTETVVNSAYPPVDNIYCDALEQTVYHIHAHLSIYINGSLSPIPANMGIASDGSCYYWLHTHDTTGVIHIESPTQKDYTLGNFFDEWSTHFSSLGFPTQLASTAGWQVWVNGKPYSGDFHNITLTAHELITLAYNSPGVKPDTVYAWNGL
ncbi:MAG TPA: hypothetical protein VKV20_02280 [Ktedonobacteraceae bacterium]|jgi:hypothetical protein|nr:hypothetical protein [Ktedonobacteraceae bacterium]